MSESELNTGVAKTFSAIARTSPYIEHAITTALAPPVTACRIRLSMRSRNCGLSSPRASASGPSRSSTRFHSFASGNSVANAAVIGPIDAGAECTTAINGLSVTPAP